MTQKLCDIFAIIMFARENNAIFSLFWGLPLPSLLLGHHSFSVIIMINRHSHAFLITYTNQPKINVTPQDFCEVRVLIEYCSYTEF